MKSYFVLNFDISEKLPSFRSWEPSLPLSMSVKFVWDSDSLELDCWYEKLLIFVLNFDISVFSENSGEFWWILVNSESKSRNDQLVSEIQKRNELTIWGLHKNVTEYLNMKRWKCSKWDLQLSHYFADGSLLFQKLVSQITAICYVKQW